MIYRVKPYTNLFCGPYRKILDRGHSYWIELARSNALWPRDNIFRYGPEKRLVYDLLPTNSKLIFPYNSLWIDCILLVERGKYLAQGITCRPASNEQPLLFDECSNVRMFDWGLFWRFEFFFWRTKHNNHIVSENIVSWTKWLEVSSFGDRIKVYQIS